MAKRLKSQKKRWPIVLLAVLVAFVGVAAFFLRGPFSLLSDAMMSDEDLQQKTEEKDKIEQEVRSQYQLPEIQLAPETLADLQNGTKTIEEVANQALEEGSGQTPQEEDANQALEEDGGQTPQEEDQAPQESGQAPQPEEDAPSGTEEPQETEEEKQIRSLLTQVYVLRDSFIGRIEGVVAECKNEYLQLDESQRTADKKAAIVYKRFGEVSNMEKECDSQVADILSQIQAIDPDLASQVRTQYQNEKAVKKAELLNRYA